MLEIYEVKKKLKLDMFECCKRNWKIYGLGSWSRLGCNLKLIKKYSLVC